MKRTLTLVSAALCLLALSVPEARGVQAAAAPDWKKVLGVWSLTVDADSFYIYLTVSLELSDGQVKGKMTEQSGMIPEVQLEAVEFDNQDLKFMVTAPSPPDGLTKTWKGAFKVSEDRLEGAFFNEELGVAVPVTGAREKKQ